MKPNETEQETQAEEIDQPAVPITGDVIGNTAYSERFVLKNLLKLANLDTLKDEVQEKSYEDDLCTLWDMTAEKDVVLFLQKHEALNLISFALPVIESPRIIEILIGIVGNMCCQKEVVGSILKMNGFLTYLLEFAKSDDSLVLVQLLRFISSCLFLSKEDDINIWLDIFTSTGYSSALYFILKNSSNKVLLVTALENYNTVCSYCNVDRYHKSFFAHFIRLEALESLCAAFTEVTIKQKHLCNRDEVERILVISLQIALNLVGFDQSYEIYCNNKDDVVTIINFILNYYEDKFSKQKEIDTDLVDIIESMNTIINILKLDNVCGPGMYFKRSYRMWKALYTMKNTETNGSRFEEDDKVELQDFCDKIKPSLSTLLCSYIANCPEEQLVKSLEIIQDEYESIIAATNNEELIKIISKRTSDYKTRIKENVYS